MRPVRLGDEAVDDLERQIHSNLIDEFRRLDLRPALDAIANADNLSDVADEHGPAWRYTADGATVSGFHLFLAADEVDPRPGAVVVAMVDIWLTDFPDEDSA